jgi:hypothetical protein
MNIYVCVCVKREKGPFHIGKGRVGDSCLSQLRRELFSGFWAKRVMCHARYSFSIHLNGLSWRKGLKTSNW